MQAREYLIRTLRCDLNDPDPAKFDIINEMLPSRASRAYLTGYLVLIDAPEDQCTGSSAASPNKALRLGRGVIHQSRKQHRLTRRQRPPRLPPVQRGGMATADRLLLRRHFVDGFQRDGDFDALVSDGLCHEEPRSFFRACCTAASPLPLINKYNACARCQGVQASCASMWSISRSSSPA